MRAQYGLSKCLQLAKNPPDQAWKDADNWAYFISEFRGDVTASDTIDWNYLDAVSFSQRPAIATGMGQP